MRRVVTALALLGLIALVAAPAEARKHRSHKPSGVAGAVLDASCYGACVEPQTPDPVYTGSVTVTVKKASNGAVVASRTVSDGRFRIKLKHGFYEVSSVPATPTPLPCEPQPVAQAQQICPPPCQPQPQQICALNSTSQSAAIVAPCVTGETRGVIVRRHRFTHLDLHVTNVCIV
jgi:hypothetical protein